MMSCGKTGTQYSIDMPDTISKDNCRRYSRNILLEGFGKEKQIELLNSSVLIVGTGALGSIVAMYLAASGIGRIGIADFDTIDISNLQRQLSFTENDLGKPKVEVTAKKLKAINSGIDINVHSGMLTKQKAAELFPMYDVIVEGSDNPATKYMVTDIALQCNRPCVVGGVAQYKGQVMTIFPHKNFTYRDVFPDAADENGYTPCSIGGVFGPLPGIIGSIQAAETIKVITDIGSTLSGKILTVDSLTMEFTTFEL